MSSIRSHLFYLLSCIDSGTDTQNQICDHDQQEVHKTNQNPKESERHERLDENKTKKVSGCCFMT